MTTRSQIMRRWWLASSVLLVIFAGSVWARTPLSVRVIGGFTGSLYTGLIHETDRLAPVGGLGLRYSITPRHSLFLDVELIRRWSTESLRGTTFNEHRLGFYPLTLGYQYQIPIGTGRFSPFLSAGIIYGRYALREEYLAYGNTGGEVQTAVASRESHVWSSGLRADMGCSVKLNSSFTVSGIMSYRFLRKPGIVSIYSTTGRADTQQNQNGVVVPGTVIEDPGWSAWSGLEGKIVLEIQL